MTCHLFNFIVAAASEAAPVASQPPPTSQSQPFDPDIPMLLDSMEATGKLFHKRRLPNIGMIVTSPEVLRGAEAEVKQSVVREAGQATLALPARPKKPPAVSQTSTASVSTVKVSPSPASPHPAADVMLPQTSRLPIVTSSSAELVKTDSAAVEKPESYQPVSVSQTSAVTASSLAEALKTVADTNVTLTTAISDHTYHKKRKKLEEKPSKTTERQPWEKKVRQPWVILEIWFLRYAIIYPLSHVADMNIGIILTKIMV